MARDWQTRTDGALLAAARTSPDAFAELYLRHEKVLAAYFLRRTHDPEVVADLTSETFARALESARSFRDDGQSALGWLFGIGRHTLLRYWDGSDEERKVMKKLAPPRVELSDASLERVEALADLEGVGVTVFQELQRLPAEQQEAVRLFVIEERPYSELSAAFGIEPAAARKRVSRGLARLRSTVRKDPV